LSLLLLDSESLSLNLLLLLLLLLNSSLHDIRALVLIALLS